MIERSQLMAALGAPFPADQVKWRIGHIAGSGERASVLAFIDARNVMNRLDEVVGPLNWEDHYRPGAAGGVCCRLSIRLGEADEWVHKEDAAENTDIEAIKGGHSDALRRCAVKWGIGRYLYNLDSKWQLIKPTYGKGRVVQVTKNRKHLGHVEIPSLPVWALPRAEAARRPPSPQRQQQGGFRG